MQAQNLKSLRHAAYGIALSCISFLALSASASAGTITIDNFSTPVSEDAYVIALINGNPLTKAYSGPGILSNSPTVPVGERTLTVNVVTFPVGLIDASGTIGNGSFDFASAINAGVESSLLYTAPGGGSLAGVDLTDGGTNSAFVFDLNSDFTFNIRIDAIGPAGSANLLFTHAGGSSIDLVPFSNFATVGAFSFSAVDQLKVSLNPGGNPKALDFELFSIKAVPEPATVVLGLFGTILAACAIRWRRAGC